ncbi:PD40 domain-containing protein [bacterium]|nr:MAG: PD40 domain-containing protein [bacterium]QQR61780.1 MAG: PD40 domain-containing protein [bacterium]QQR62642.1 MAG: PD40 domain-containing protein [bacterium]
MNGVRIFLLGILIFNRVIFAFELTVKADSAGKMPLYICYVKGSQQYKLPFAYRVFESDLEFMGIFDFKSEVKTAVLTKKERKEILGKGYGLGLFLVETEDVIDVYVHNMLSDKTVIGKRFTKSVPARVIAHRVADTVFSTLLSEPSFFLTRIAYVKEVPSHLHSFSPKRILCVVDYDGSCEQAVIETPLAIFGPRWSSRLNVPMLFYSEHTATNIRLMTVDLQKKKKISSTVDGMTLLPCCLPNGNGVVYCSTGSNGYTQLFLYTFEGVKQLTFYQGNSLSPSITSDGSLLYFCSDYASGTPQIFSYRFSDGMVEPITTDGYCTSPAVCQRTGNLLYTKMVQGIMQIMLYDPKLANITQLTFDRANKDCVSWSPCGKYILYGFESGQQQRIAMLNIVNKKTVFITPTDVRCSYPSWSPVYNHFPIFV